VARRPPLREEQRRSDARIAALAAALDTPSPVLMADDAGAPTGNPGLTPPARDAGRGVARDGAAVSVPVLVSLDDTRPEMDFAPEGPRPDTPLVAAPPADVAPVEVDTPVSAHDTVRAMERPLLGGAAEPGPETEPARVSTTRDLFGDVDAPPRSDDRRWLAVAAVVMVFLLGGAALWSLSSGTGSAAGTATQAAAPGGIALELVALGHDQAGKALLVRGLVRNPPAASTRANTYVQVRLFDEGGAPLGSGRGVLDVPSLVPGDEAAFTVELPADPRVRRYRVTFREPDGNLVPHVDIRAASR
jgi:hypothetical protein